MRIMAFGLSGVMYNRDILYDICAAVQDWLGTYLHG